MSMHTHTTHTQMYMQHPHIFKYTTHIHSPPPPTHTCTHSHSQGLGTDDRTLVRVVVTRSEVDMVQIKNGFFGLYKQTLASFIKVRGALQGSLATSSFVHQLSIPDFVWQLWCNLIGNYGRTLYTTVTSLAWELSALVALMLSSKYCGTSVSSKAILWCYSYTVFTNDIPFFSLQGDTSGDYRRLLMALIGNGN